MCLTGSSELVLAKRTRKGEKRVPELQRKFYNKVKVRQMPHSRSYCTVTQCHPLLSLCSFSRKSLLLSSLPSRFHSLPPEPLGDNQTLSVRFSDHISRPLTFLVRFVCRGHLSLERPDLDAKPTRLTEALETPNAAERLLTPVERRYVLPLF